MIKRVKLIATNSKWASDAVEKGLAVVNNSYLVDSEGSRAIWLTGENGIEQFKVARKDLEFLTPIETVDDDELIEDEDICSNCGEVIDFCICKIEPEEKTSNGRTAPQNEKFEKQISEGLAKVKYDFEQGDTVEAISDSKGCQEFETGEMIPFNKGDRFYVERISNSLVVKAQSLSDDTTLAIPVMWLRKVEPFEDQDNEFLDNNGFPVKVEDIKVMVDGKEIEGSVESTIEVSNEKEDYFEDFMKEIERKSKPIDYAFKRKVIEFIIDLLRDDIDV